VTQNILQNTLEFCALALGPTTPEMHESVSKRVDARFMMHDGPILTTKALVALVGDDEEAQQVVSRVNSRKAISTIWNWEENFKGEKFNGFSATLKQGCLGLQRVL
jgi:hypothetical protein